MTTLFYRTWVKMKAETTAFIQLIRDALGKEPPGASLRVKSFPHDFGTYHEVVCFFDEADQEAMEYAYKCEEQAPTDWAWNGKDYRPVLA
jgi:hypothetical protein